MPHLPNAHKLDRQARAIVESLDGTWRRDKGMCCCPAHDDRTPSLSVTLGRKAILFHCFAGCSNEAVIAALERCGVRSRNLFDSFGSVESQPKKNLPFSPNARRLWQSAPAITGSPAERYLAERGLMSTSDQLRFLGRTPLGPRGAVQFLPAMLAAVTTDSGIIAIHRTFLDRASARLAGFERPKRALGSLGYGAVSLGHFQELTGLRIEAPDGSMVDDLPSIQRWLNRILALPIALQNAIFDEFMGLVEARIDAARQAGTLDLGLETIAVEDFTVLADTLLRTDPASGATTHLLELETARALKPLTLKRLEELYGLAGQQQQPVRNARSGRVALLVPARSILADDGTRVSRFELLRPLKRSHITEDQLADSSWERISIEAFREAWIAEVDEARTSHKRERLYLATGLLLPVWDKLPSDFVRVSRISATDGRSLLGREVPVHCVPELCRALGLEREQTLSADDIVQTVLATGRAMEFAGREQLMVKRSLVNGSQRIELTGWSAARLDWYKAQGCFTEIIRYQTRLFVPLEGAAGVIGRLASSA
jgi:hypothetical protein